MLRILWVCILVPAILWWVPPPWSWMWVSFIIVIWSLVIIAALRRPHDPPAGFDAGVDAHIALTPLIWRLGA